MKKMMVGLALAAMAASPAFAQSEAARNARAEAHTDGQAIKHHHAAKSARRHSTSVYVNGEYRGTDPDPRIRHEMGRGFPNTDLGN